MTLAGPPRPPPFVPSPAELKRLPVATPHRIIDRGRFHDRREKAPLYARAGVPLYWIVNLQESVVEVYSDLASHPTARYQRVDRHTAADPVVLTLAGQALAPLAVGGMLP